jgi:hypothetical protein
LRRSEAEKTARYVKDQFACDEEEENDDLRAGVEPDVRDVDWQMSHRAIFDDNQRQGLDDPRSGSFVPHVDITELFILIRELVAMGYWKEQEAMTMSGGTPDGMPAYAMRVTYTDNRNGDMKHEVNGFPSWPMGVVLMREAFLEHDFEAVAKLIQLFAKIAELVLRTPQGVIRYLMGAPLYYDTMSAVGFHPPRPGLTDEGLVFCTHFPYVPRILGLSDIELCGPDAWSRISGAVARNMLLSVRISRLNEGGRDFAKESLQNMRSLTVLQGPCLEKYDQPRTASILKGHAQDEAPPGPSTERAPKQTRFSRTDDDDPADHDPAKIRREATQWGSIRTWEKKRTPLQSKTQAETCPRLRGRRVLDGFDDCG